MRLLLRLIAIVVIVGAAAWFWITSAPEIPAAPPPTRESLDREAIERGEELALIGDCSACHTAVGGDALAGGLGLPTPFGTIYSTNITPDPETGIGTWPLEAFARAMRRGLDREGNHLYPAFPYDHFTRTTDADIAALYAWLMSQPPVVAKSPQNDMPFPFSYRPVLAGWKFLFLDTSPFEADPALDEEQAHGAYLVASLGHCGACHSPRNMFGAVIEAHAFEGGEAEGWTVPSIGAASRAPMSWTADDYVEYLFDGWTAAHGVAAGPMTSVANHLYDANEDDVFAMAAYLASLTPEPDEAARAAALKQAAALDWIEGAPSGGFETPEDAALLAGEAIFGKNCARCHKERVAETQPASLALTPPITEDSPQNLAHVVLRGIVPPYGARQRTMPKRLLSAEEMANLAAYVRWRFSNLPPWDNITETVGDVIAPHQ